MADDNVPSDEGVKEPGPPYCGLNAEGLLGFFPGGFSCNSILKEDFQIVRQNAHWTRT